MAYERFYGPDEYFWGWRCIFCGEIIDQIILENRGDLEESMMASGRRGWQKKGHEKR
jgi:hypothetical protein